MLFQPAQQCQCVFGFIHFSLNMRDFVLVPGGHGSSHVIVQALQFCFGEANTVLYFHDYTNGISSCVIVERCDCSSTTS